LIAFAFTFFDESKKLAKVLCSGLLSDPSFFFSVGLAFQGIIKSKTLTPSKRGLFSRDLFDFYS
jgi:hypothetical protein